jgi:proline racemase
MGEGNPGWVPVSTHHPQVVQTIDYHTAGEPFRIVTGGVGPIPGATMLEKRRYAAVVMDPIRQLLINEPRGHADMYGCFVTEPVSPDGDLGVLFFHNDGYSTACGHGTIALVTAALESGMLPLSHRMPGEDGRVPVVIDAPSGRLETTAMVDASHRVTGVRFRNVPSYLDRESVAVELPDGKQVDAAIAFGGAFYALVDLGQLGLHVDPHELPNLITYGRQIKAAVEAIRIPEHPVERELRGIYGVIFAETCEARTNTCPRRDANVTIFANGEVDRSPCGSGTSARLAALHASGELADHEILIHEGILGTRFTGSVVEECDLEGRSAVITEIEGSAWLSGYHTFILEPGDPLGTGYLLR